MHQISESEESEESEEESEEEEEEEEEDGKGFIDSLFKGNGYFLRHETK